MRDPSFDGRSLGDVYIHHMAGLERTQIYLTRAETDVLERLKEKTGTSQSELIRRAIDRMYSSRSAAGSIEERLRIARRAAGAWRDRTETGAEYVERVRGSGRLARLARR